MTGISANEFDRRIFATLAVVDNGLQNVPSDCYAEIGFVDARCVASETTTSTKKLSGMVTIPG